MILINGKEWNLLTKEDIQTAIDEVEESFFFEFKEDGVKSSKLVEEVSAFANTYGGYIFLGVADDKTIVGCKEWNEQRIFAVIHDSLSPVPSFDVKKCVYENGNIIYVVRIDEGAEPPYITNKGLIYERISSSSCVVKDSSRLTQMYIKRKDQENFVEQKISIKSIESDVNNIWGYIDIGFSLVLRDSKTFTKRFYDINLNDLMENVFKEKCSANVSRIGSSIVLSFGGLSADSPNKALPAHLNNFIEIMYDGSVRLRVLLLNNNPNDCSVNMFLSFYFVDVFSNTFLYIFKDLLVEGFVYAKKYEKLTVRKQFFPSYYYTEEFMEVNEKARTKNERIKEVIEKHIEKTGKDQVITDDRIPKTGLFTVDRKKMERDNLEYNVDNIVFELFHSRFLYIGYVPGQEDGE